MQTKNTSFKELEEITHSALIETLEMTDIFRNQAAAIKDMEVDFVKVYHFLIEPLINNLDRIKCLDMILQGNLQISARMLVALEQETMKLEKQAHCDVVEDKIRGPLYKQFVAVNEILNDLEDDTGTQIEDIYELTEEQMKHPVECVTRKLMQQLLWLENIEKQIYKLEDGIQVLHNISTKDSSPLDMDRLKIVSLDVKDIRFPTSLNADGSDAMHTDPDYSCAYVTVRTESGEEGNGLTFTLGRGTEVVVSAVKSLSPLVVGRIADQVFEKFGEFWRSLTSESQIRWIGPEKGVTHLAVAAITNALWDLWAKWSRKPIWQLLSDMEPEQLVAAIDFRYISDVITPDEAIEILRKNKEGREKRLEILKEKGYPAYTTQVGWLGYSNEKVEDLCRQYLKEGYTAFKLKVGRNIEDDLRRLEIVRRVIGPDNKLMVDANQIWEVNEAIAWMKQLTKFNVTWIEEPTSPDDILGHAAIAKALKPYSVGVATGEMCANRVMFKQFMQADAMQYCQIDSARIGGVNEILSVYLMAHKLGVKVCPHAGGVGLCEMVQHLQMWDYLSLSGTMEGRIIEYVDQQHEHFTDELVVKNAHYQLPTYAGYGTTFKKEAIEKYEYPNGTEWQSLFAKGLFKNTNE